MDLKDKIRERRLELNLTLEDVARVVGVGKSTVRKWETGYIENMRRDKIAKLAEALHTTPAYLMGWEDDFSPLPDNILPMPSMGRVPLLGEIACGHPITAEENIEDIVDLPEHVKADFALRCRGDSMINARIFDGDIVYIRQQPDVANGEIAAVLIDHEATLKRVYHYADRLELRPENPTFPVLQYEGEQLSEIRILGKAVAFTSTVR